MPTLAVGMFPREESGMATQTRDHGTRLTPRGQTARSN